MSGTYKYSWWCVLIWIINVTGLIWHRIYWPVGCWHGWCIPLALHDCWTRGSSHLAANNVMKSLYPYLYIKTRFLNIGELPLVSENVCCKNLAIASRISGLLMMSYKQWQAKELENYFIDSDRCVTSRIHYNVLYCQISQSLFLLFSIYCSYYWNLIWCALNGLADEARRGNGPSSYACRDFGN